MFKLTICLILFWMLMTNETSTRKITLFQNSKIWYVTFFFGKRKSFLFDNKYTLHLIVILWVSFDYIWFIFKTTHGLLQSSSWLYCLSSVWQDLSTPLTGIRLPCLCLCLLSLSGKTCHRCGSPMYRANWLTYKIMAHFQIISW